MFTILITLRKRPELSQEEFRRIWKEEYGPLYQQIPEVKSYTQYHLQDRRKDETEDPIDGVAIMSFDSEEDMKKAWSSEIYKKIIIPHASLELLTICPRFVCADEESTEAYVCTLQGATRRKRTKMG